MTLLVWRPYYLGNPLYEQLTGVLAPRGRTGVPSDIVVRLRRLSGAAKASAQLAADDRQARDQAIAEADDAGMKLRQISRETGMSVSHVQRVVLAETLRRQNSAG